MMMITPEVRANMISVLDKQSPPEIQGSWLTDRFMHNTFVSRFVPGVGIDAEEITGKNNHEIRMLVNRRIN